MTLDGRVLWSDTTLVLRWAPTEDLAHTRSGRQRLSLRPQDVVVEMRAIERVEAVQPWPSLYVRWSDGPVSRAIRFHPRGPSPPLPRSRDRLHEYDTFADVVAMLLDDHCVPPGAAARGWLDVEDVPWERVDALPHEARVTGPFRSPGRSRAVVAARARRSPLATPIEWLVRDRRLLDRRMREVVLTHDHAYVQLGDRTRWRLPRDTLGARVTAAGAEDAVYVFGRRTFLSLAGRADCPVVRSLDRQLARET